MSDLADRCLAVANGDEPLNGPDFKVIARRLLIECAGKLKEIKADTDRLNWLEQQTESGRCPALVFDDNGHWAVSFEGTQSVPISAEPELVQTSFWIEAEEWKESARAAIDAVRAIIE